MHVQMNIYLHTLTVPSTEAVAQTTGALLLLALLLLVLLLMFSEEVPANARAVILLAP